jgi:hypothetical protein
MDKIKKLVERYGKRGGSVLSSKRYSAVNYKKLTQEQKDKIFREALEKDFSETILLLSKE